MYGAGELERLVRCFQRLEAGNTSHDPPVHFRQNNVHGQICWGKPTLGVLPVLLAAGGKSDLKNRATRRIQWRRAPCILPGKSRGVDNNGRAGLHECRTEPWGCGSLERGGKQTRDTKPTRLQGLYQRINGGRVSAGQIRTIEHDNRKRAVSLWWSRHNAHTGLVPTIIRYNRHWPHRRRGQACGLRQQAECGMGCLCPTCVAQPGKITQAFGRNGRKLIQCWVSPAISRNNSQCHAGRAGQSIELFQPVAPVSRAANQPHQHRPAVGKGALDIGIDTQRMFKGGKVGKAQRGQGALSNLPACRKGTQVTV